MLILTVSSQALAASTMTAAPSYQPPADTAGLQIVELLPHSQSCSPVDTDLLCSDYVKLFNSSDMSINLTNYRLRTSYGGQNGSSRNTFSLDGSLDAGQYVLINTRDDGSPMTLTQSGGYVWLEDTYGIQAYDPVVEYPDASAASKVGQAWAFDGAEWQWTDSPQPDGPNDFPLLVVTEPETPSPSVSVLKPCAPDQTRNPVTNRCRKIPTITKTLMACKPGQIRSLVTNRCRSAKTANKTLTPCKPGQIRSSATNRCRSILAATKTKTPCKPNQERNPDTGRCRKVQPKITPVHDIKTASKTTDRRWYLLAAISAGAAGYVFYEWRQEFSAGLERVKTKFWLPRRQTGQNLLK